MIVNGGFASGLTGWTVSNAGVGLGGSAEVVTSLGSQVPLVLSQFALLDSGPAATLGSSTPTYGQLSQSFTLASATTLDLTFRYTLLTSRFTGAFATENDSFLAEIRPTAGAPTAIFSSDVATGAFVPVPDVSGIISSPNGASFLEYVPAISVNQSISLAAGTYTLVFKVTSNLNSLFDSGMLIDNVILNNKGTSATPEPASMLLTAAGLLFAVACASRKARA